MMSIYLPKSNMIEKLENILQWNCNGCKNNYCHLKTIILEKSPFCICLQETHFKPDESFTLRGYSVFRKDVIPNQRARGGVGIFIRDTIPATPIPLQTDMQAIAIQINFPLNFVICNIYLPEFDWNRNELINLIQQLPKPFLLLGDFNSHNPIWGSSNLDTRGRIIEEVINELDLVVLNTGEGT